MRGTLLEIQSTLYDLRPKTLENYGSLSARDREALDSHLSRLFALLEDMNSAL